MGKSFRERPQKTPPKKTHRERVSIKFSLFFFPRNFEGVWFPREKRWGDEQSWGQTEAENEVIHSSWPLYEGLSTGKHTCSRPCPCWVVFHSNAHTREYSIRIFLSAATDYPEMWCERISYFLRKCLPDRADNKMMAGANFVYRHRIFFLIFFFLSANKRRHVS